MRITGEHQSENIFSEFEKCCTLYRPGVIMSCDLTLTCDIAKHLADGFHTNFVLIDDVFNCSVNLRIVQF